MQKICQTKSYVEINVCTYVCNLEVCMFACILIFVSIPKDKDVHTNFHKKGYYAKRSCEILIDEWDGWDSLMRQSAVMALDETAIHKKK